MTPSATDEGQGRSEAQEVPYEIRAECLARWIERNRAALMAVHADDWDMETISEAAHICAHAQALVTFGVSTGPRS